MEINSFPSKLLEDAVEEFAKLPGIGRKTALRLVLHLLKQPSTDVAAFSATLQRLSSEVRYCRSCNSISDTDLCSICSSSNRNKTLLCVVESIKDVMSIEGTGQYHGIYYVLGGLISPMDGVGPSDLNLEGLVNKISEGSVQEVILALSATMEGDTTGFYVFKKIKGLPVDVSAIARGVAFGDDLEYADEVTLGRAITNRTKFEAAMAN